MKAEIALLLVLAAMFAVLALAGSGCCARASAPHTTMAGWDLWRDAQGRMVATEPGPVTCGAPRRLRAPTHVLEARGRYVALVDVREAETWTDEGRERACATPCGR
jgi:hypothetical protein